MLTNTTKTSKYKMCIYVFIDIFRMYMRLYNTVNAFI